MVPICLVPNFERRTKKEPLSHSLHHQPNEKVEAREPKVTLLWILVLIRFLEAVFVCDATRSDSEADSELGDERTDNTGDAGEKCQSGANRQFGS